MKLKGVKIKLIPNDKQKEQIDTNIKHRRFVKNKMLGMQIARYENGGKYQSKFAMIYCLKALKAEFPFLKNAESTCLEYGIADLDQAYQRFFKGQNDRPKFERRKQPHNSYKSKCINKNITVVDNHYIKLPKLGLVKAYGLERIQGKIKSAVIHKNPTGKYSATIQVEYEPVTLDKTGNAVGLDLGLADLVIQSNGFKLKNKKFERTMAKKRRLWERKLARRRIQTNKKIDDAKKNGVELDMSDFKNVEKARQMVAKINRKIANQREDYLQKYTTSLVKEFDVIAMEELQTKNMMQNHKLSRSIADSAWAKIKSMLEYKCEWYGKQLILVAPQYTSQNCSACGENTGKKPLSVREFTCPYCGTHHDRDINAAVNILNKAFA
ncbi:MAG: transposase [Lactobacillales bacterium]|jgi:putative transposase|nr:transposase [Lactobacillales bacterium]